MFPTTKWTGLLSLTPSRVDFCAASGVVLKTNGNGHVGTANVLVVLVLYWRRAPDKFKIKQCVYFTVINRHLNQIVFKTHLAFRCRLMTVK